MPENSTPVVVIHGSALRSPNPGDLDVIFVGDRSVAARTAREWAVDFLGDRGGNLSLDMHQATGEVVIVPQVPGRKAPYVVASGDIAPGMSIQVVEYRGTASWLRSPHDANTIHRAITNARDCGLPLLSHLSLTEATNGWGAYCDGPQALRSAITKCAVWQELRELDPELYKLIETVAEMGDSALPPALRHHLVMASGGDSGAALVDVVWRGGVPFVGAAYSAVEWNLPDFTRLLRGEPIFTPPSQRFGGSETRYRDHLAAITAR